jgi:multidrug efflux system outer membrane protein
VTAAQGSLEIAQDQYRTGFVTFVNVYQAQISLFNAQDQLTQSDGQIVTDLVAIYKALGGGWSETTAAKAG